LNDGLSALPNFFVATAYTNRNRAPLQIQGTEKSESKRRKKAKRIPKRFNG